MERFQNILFASFGGKEDLAALDRAKRLAQTNKARLTLVRVIEGLPLAASYFLPKKRLNEFREASEAMARAELAELAKHVDQTVEVETRVVFGKPFIELIRAVLKDGHDVLIKSRAATIRANALESTDLHLLRKCPCPVWIIRPNQRKPFGKIFVAVDPDPSDAERLGLHADLLKLATSLAERENSKVEVVHSWMLEGETMLRSPRFNMSEDEIEALAKDVKSTHRRWLDDLLKPYADHNIKVSMVEGPFGPTLVEQIEKKKPDIVVMGTLARSGLPGLLIGNTAEYVLGQISSSILAIKPKGFKSPVV